MRYLIIINISMLIGGVTAALWYSSEGYLKSQGYSPLYIKAKKRFGFKSGVIQLTTLFITEAVILLILNKLGKEFSTDVVINIVIPGIFVTVIPVSILLSVRFNKELKKLAVETGENIVIDFDHALLRKAFDLRVEIPATVLIIILGYIAFKEDGFTTLLYSMGIPWMLYFTVRFSKSMNSAAYKEGYRLMFVFHRLYGIILILMAAAFTLGNVESFSDPDLIPALSCCGILLGKAIVLFMKYPALKRELESIELTA